MSRRPGWEPFPLDEDDTAHFTAMNWGIGSPANGFLQPLVTLPIGVVVQEVAERQVHRRRQRAVIYARTKREVRELQLRAARTERKDDAFDAWLAWTVERNAATRVGQPPPPVPCCPGFRPDSIGLCWNCGEWEHEHPHQHYGPEPRAAGEEPCCPGYRPDHNGECLNCDEWADQHPEYGPWQERSTDDDDDDG